MERALLLLIPSVTGRLIQNEESSTIEYIVKLETDVCVGFCDTQCSVLVESINI